MLNHGFFKYAHDTDVRLKLYLKQIIAYRTIFLSCIIHRAQFYYRLLIHNKPHHLFTIICTDVSNFNDIYYGSLL